jgi:hypothetical protein
MVMNLLRIIVVLGICVIALGFYRGWFTLSTHGPYEESNVVDVNLSVDPDKMKEDVEQVKESTKELGSQITDDEALNEKQERTIERIDADSLLFIIRT